MAQDIYQLNDYKFYMTDKLENDFKGQRGLRLQLAKHIGCQPSYLSQVLNGNPHLTLEQSHLVNGFFGHNKAESRYFLLLVQYARAGTKDLEKVFLEQIEEEREARFHLKKRLKNTEEIPDEARHRYYSAWYYAAIHVSLSIPDLQSVQAIAARLNLPVALVSEVISFLEENHLIKKTKKGFELTKNRIHLDRDSVFIQRHHVNWRSQALLSSEKNIAGDLHYSNVITLSKKDFNKIKDVLVRAIEDAREIIRPSKEEEVYAITVDAFKL